MPRTPDPTEEEANNDTDSLILHMEAYFMRYYGPRCEEFETDCPVCEVWKLHDAIQVWIK